MKGIYCLISDFLAKHPKIYILLALLTALFSGTMLATRSDLYIAWVPFCAFIISSFNLASYKLGTMPLVEGYNPFWNRLVKKHGKEKGDDIYRRGCLKAATVLCIIGSIGFLIAIATELVFYIIGIK